MSEHQRLAHQKLSKKEGVLSKHRKWLKQLQQTKEELQDEYLKGEEEKKEKREKFMAREAQMRAVVRGTLGPSRHDYAEEEGGEEAGEEEGGEEKKESDSAVPPLNLTGKAEPKTGKKKKGAKKPAWAKTEEKAEVDEDEDLLDEEGDLMDFVDDLNFDKYVRAKPGRAKRKRKKRRAEAAVAQRWAGRPKRRFMRQN
jgi:hypothetical protein